MVESRLQNMWNQHIRQDYDMGLLNSERCLQASFYRALRIELPEHIIFVEPLLELKSTNIGRNFVPDIIVCNENKIEAILELKFVPHGYPNYKKDLAKLFTLSTLPGQNEFFISLDPDSGKFSNGKYTFSENPIFVFAVIGQHDAEAVDRTAILGSLPGQVPSNFVLLFGKVGPGNIREFDMI